MSETLKAGILLFNKSMTVVLLVQTINYETKELKWGIPKGKCDNNETIENCATREFLEETGNNIHIYHGDPYQDVTNTEKNIRTRYFILKTDREPLLRTDLSKGEVKKCKFVRISDLDDMNTNYDTRLLLKRKINICKRKAILI
jgi:ADP-ribose pyrophosphatase YjhB (NUDIX family)